MNLMDCYRRLGVPPSAGTPEIKAAYRQLARRYHPDVNPGDSDAQDKFIQVTEAYDVIMRALALSATWKASSSTPSPPPPPATAPPPPAAEQPPQPKSQPVPGSEPQTKSQTASQPETPPSPPPAPPKATPQPERVAPPRETSPPTSSSPVAQPSLSEAERKLKQSSYQQLQDLLRLKRFAKATALIEGLAKRLPNDTEVRQWQAITYQCWGRQLISDRKPDKARALLKKALHTDPHNRSLWSEVERDFRRLDRML